MRSCRGRFERLEKAASAGTYICPYESAAAYLSIGDEGRAMVVARNEYQPFGRIEDRAVGVFADFRAALVGSRSSLDQLGDTVVASRDQQAGRGVERQAGRFFATFHGVACNDLMSAAVDDDDLRCVFDV